VNKRLPDDAIDYYLALGFKRTQRAVAEHFQVAKRTVAYRAKKEGWLARAQEADQKARQVAAQRAQDTVEDMHARHMKAARFVQLRALEAIRSLPIRTESAAVRALDVGIRQERLARGEPSDAAEKDAAAVLREEHKRFVEFVEGQGDAS
jgi:transposase